MGLLAIEMKTIRAVTIDRRHRGRLSALRCDLFSRGLVDGDRGTGYAGDRLRTLIFANRVGRQNPERKPPFFVILVFSVA